jgi:hypothetical protein
MRSKRLGVIAGIAALTILVVGAGTVAGIRHAQADTPTHATSGVPAYKHIFYIMMENHSYGEIIGNSNAPNINALASQYGLATNYWGITHPSEPNYVASVSGSFYGIQDDNSWTTHSITQPYLGSQLEAAGLTWKTYQQSMPTDTTGKETDFVVNGARLYATKHNPFLNFLAFYPQSQVPAELAKMVPDTQLATDLASDDAPNLAYIVPDQCHDMHGTKGCSTDAQIISEGDTYVNDAVQLIMSSKTWQEGNNAIVITWDENDFSPTNGFPGIASGGGHVATIVIANHGPRGVKYDAPANHYALLLTIEDAFHLSCLRDSCPAQGNIQPMSPLFKASDN